MNLFENNRNWKDKPLKILAIIALNAACIPVQAQTTSTTTTVVSEQQSSSSALTLPSTAQYLAVDPITGSFQGNYDPVTGLIDGRTSQSGLLIVDRSSGNVVATIDSAGRTVDVAVAPATDVLVVSIDARRKDLDRQLAEAVKRGQRSTSEISGLRAELNRIAADRTAATAEGTFTYRRALVTAYDLNSLAQRLDSIAAVTPVITPQIVVVNKQVSMVDPITYRKLELLNRIDNEYQAGRLSADNVSHLKAQM